MRGQMVIHLSVLIILKFSVRDRIFYSYGNHFSSSNS